LLSDQSEDTIRRSVVDATQRQLREPQRQPRPIVTRRTDLSQSLGIRPEQMGEVEKMAGLRSYDGAALELGENLQGEPVKAMGISLGTAIRTSVDHNLALQFARLGPGIGEAQVAAAEAAFDWVLFSNLTWNNSDSPRGQTGFTGGTLSPVTAEVSQSIGGQAGVRRTLIGGGRLTLQADQSYRDDDSPGQISNPNPANTVALAAQWDQPLLRGAGSEVSQAEIRIARNVERNAVETLRRDMIRTATQVESTYWELVRARYDLQILTRLLDRGVKVRDQLEQRARIDANQAQIADARARVESRRADVLAAQAQVRILSNRLKGLINDPAMPVGSEVVLLPSDEPQDQPIQFSLVESLRTAIVTRPEVQQSILAIDDASIRQTVARNQTLPDLQLRMQARLETLNNTTGEALGDTLNAEFVDYVLGLVLEVPIGNRRAEADLRRRELERLQTTLAYQNAVKDVVEETKSALERARLNYTQIAQRRNSRLTAAESLRVLLVEKETLQGYTVERLDLELSQEERLAAAERAEIEALTQYNTALAELFQAMGTALERNNIRLVIPTSAGLGPMDLPMLPSDGDAEPDHGPAGGAEKTAPSSNAPAPSTTSATDQPAANETAEPPVPTFTPTTRP
jgi:outer membrane protein TolC